jgi:S-DNA-T family DNA segregation ATPase FtsK/SpoIIIE
METDAWQASRMEIPLVLGKDVSGNPVVLELAQAPHLLIAGATGSGKSVCMNTLIMSLLMKFGPEDLKLILVDPKVVEMADYATLPHLITPVIDDFKKVPLALRWAATEMDKRYKQLAKAGVRKLKDYNSRQLPETPVLDDDNLPIPDKLPVLIVIIDELADLMQTDARSDIETSISRIAAKGRAAGVHIVVATQRPSRDVITGTIKSNLPTRISFRVPSLTDSRVILDQKGAEALLGMGDMLLLAPKRGLELERIQGAWVADGDIKQVVKFVSDQAPQSFDDQVVASADGEDGDDVPGSRKGSRASGGDWSEEETDAFIDNGFELDPMVARYMQPGDDDLVRRALEVVLLEKKASTSYIQRRLKIGYNRAAELIDLMEERGIVGPPSGSGAKRDILVFDDILN